MNYVGEYVIPIAALILVAVVFGWREVVIVVVLVTRFVKRVAGRR
jgi:hypothetical protein